MPSAASIRRVFLIGFMGAGKTSAGKALAAHLGWRFQDLDDLIEAREGARIATLFTERGEAGFRDAEAQALEHLLQDAASQSDLVVALGGGTFVQPRNRVLLERYGAVTVLLDAPAEELRRRCQAEDRIRPLAGDEERFLELYVERQPAYARARHKVQTMNKTVKAVAAEIAELLSSRLEVKK
ncbi:MAG TPA: shikimate kinase [Candidatus Limnocylindrales bacterium]|jgi:shikimate kinase|nr:shikimate kinase [Candidatus Limnocylindrales bacterium]